MADRPPGWDSQAINRIANEHYGSLAGLFEAMDWPERGAAMMPAQMRRVAETYGSVEAFVEAHRVDPWAPAADIWKQGYSVYWSSFWDWTPETWGTVGFTQSGRRDTIIRETTQPFIFVIYITQNAKVDDKTLPGSVAGFYLVTHEKGHRDAFTHPSYHRENAEKWQFSLKAIRAFSFLPEYRPEAWDLDPTLKKRALAVANAGEVPSDDVISALKRIPYVEVPVYGGWPVARPDFIAPDAMRESQKTGVRGGTVNRSGYTVPGEPPDTPKELYALRLDGDVSAFLPDGAPPGTEIFKIGLSMSPTSRMVSFNAALPGERFQWVIHRTTRQDGHEAYPSFEAALAGEDEMKRVLGEPGGWMGGEFYSADPETLERAWARGRHAALVYE
jgi:hypothetical protein